MIGNSHPYHHGDLRTALVEAGLEFSRLEGSEAIRLRELARSVGVTPNAAYRHFANRQELILSIAVAAQHRLVRVMRKKMNPTKHKAKPDEIAIQHLRGVGLGYIHFAVSNPGWFELAFLPQTKSCENSESVAFDNHTPPPFTLLTSALDEMADAHILTKQQRKNAEWICWSAVHGFAELAIRGPLRKQDHKVVDKLARQVVDTIIKGLQTQ